MPCCTLSSILLLLLLALEPVNVYLFVCMCVCVCVLFFVFVIMYKTSDYGKLKKKSSFFVFDDNYALTACILAVIFLNINSLVKCAHLCVCASLSGDYRKKRRRTLLQNSHQPLSSASPKPEQMRKKNKERS